MRVTDFASDNSKSAYKTEFLEEEIMARTILLTSLSAAEYEQPVRYFSVSNQYGYSYCDAIMSVEASTKYVLSRYDIDEIFVIGRNSTFDEGDDGRPIVLKEGSSFYSSDIRTLSAYSLYRYRIAQFIDELTIEQQEYMELLPEETQEQIITFIKDFFQAENKDHEIKKKNRYFDELACNRELYTSFKEKLIQSVPGASDNPKIYIRWAKNYLFSTFKASWKLEILPVNEDVSVRFIPTSMLESGENVDNMMSIANTITNDGHEDISLFVSLHSEDAADSFVIMNMLDILISLPGSHVKVQKVFTVSGANKYLTGRIHDGTSGFGITELVAAIRAFLRYGKADMIVDFWEKSGERNEKIASMIYAMRHIDTGLSMCNTREVEEGILRLKNLFKNGLFMGESGYFSRMFNLVVDGIRKDYGVLLEGDEIPFIDLVKWAYRHRFYQQTLTLIESRAPENFVNSGLFYYCNNEEKKNDIIHLLALQRLELKPYEYFKMDEIDHYFVKTYNRALVKNRGDRNADAQEIYASLRTESLDNTNPDMITGYTACDNPQTLKNLLHAYYRTSFVRNKISHADENAMAETRMAVAESGESTAFIMMKDSMDYFISSYEKAVKELEGKNPVVVKITSSEVKQCADMIRKDEKKDDRHWKHEPGSGNHPRRNNEKKDSRSWKNEPKPADYPRRNDR